MEFARRDRLLVIALILFVIYLILYRILTRKKKISKSEFEEKYVPAIKSIQVVYDYSKLFFMVFEDFSEKFYSNSKPDTAFQDMKTFDAAHQKDYEIELEVNKNSVLKTDVFSHGDNIRDIMNTAKREKDAVLEKYLKDIKDLEMKDTVENLNYKVEKTVSYFFENFYENEKYSVGGMDKKSEQYTKLDESITSFNYEEAYDEVTAFLLDFEKEYKKYKVVGN